MTNELKTYSAHIFELGCMDQQVYIKSEADKVITEKDTKIIQLEALIENYNRISEEIIDNANHQKYRRCLAIARWCRSVWSAIIFIHEGHGAEHYMKWENRWLALANKFKEAENGNSKRAD